MSIIKNSILVALFTISSLGFSQDYKEPTSTNTEFNVKGDSRIEKLIKTYDKLKKKNNKVSVYRVQVFSGQRDNATKALAVFKKNHYQQYSNIIYDQPNFKVKVGAFRTKEEANAFIDELSSAYRSAFVLKEKIDYDEFIKDRSIVESEEGETEENSEWSN